MVHHSVGALMVVDVTHTHSKLHYPLILWDSSNKLKQCPSHVKKVLGTF